MYSFYFDASGLVKRYIPENGSASVKFLFENVPFRHMMCLTVGVAEVFSACVRKRNAALLPQLEFEQAIAHLKNETISSDSDFQTLSVHDTLIWESMDMMDHHAINSVDAIVLCSAMQIAASLRKQNNELILITSDKYLVRAARREELLCFDPENDSQAVLQDWIAPH